MAKRIRKNGTIICDVFNHYIESHIAAHFNLGTDFAVAAVPESKYAYAHREFKPTPFDPTLAKDIKTSHIGYLFNPKHDGNMPAMGRTNYQEKISDPAKSARAGPDYEHRDLHATTFLIGTSPPTLQSEAASKYARQEHGATCCDIKGTIEMMKRPSFEYKHTNYPTDLRAQYTTEAKGRYSPVKPTGGESQAAANLLTYSKQAHFSLGSQGNSLVSTKQIYFTGVPGAGEAAKLNVAQLKDLKSVHFALGDCKDKPESYYKKEHVWIQPTHIPEVNS